MTTASDLPPYEPQRVLDAAIGLVDEGRTELAPMRELQPWPVAGHAEALLRGSTGSAG